MDRVPAFEQGERAGCQVESHGVGAVAFEEALDASEVRLDRAPNVGHVLEDATPNAALEHERYNEIRLVKVPEQFVVIHHDGEIEGTQRIGIAPELRFAQRDLEKREQALPFVEPAAQRLAWE